MGAVAPPPAVQPAAAPPFVAPPPPPMAAVPPPLPRSTGVSGFGAAPPPPPPVPPRATGYGVPPPMTPPPVVGFSTPPPVPGYGAPNAVPPPPPSSPVGFGAPPPPPFPGVYPGTSAGGGAYFGGSAYSTGAGGGLPASPPLWDFQAKLIPTGESLVSGLGPNPTGLMKILARIVRATFLDPRVARQAALEESGTGEAIGAIVVTVVPGIVLGWLGASSFGLGILSALISTVLMSVVSLGIMVGLLSALSQSLLGVRLSAGQLLRALAYSQGANMLSFVPGVGRLLSLWTIVSGVAAVREISGADTQKVAIFMIVGAVAGVVVAMVIGPIVFGMLSIF